VVVCQSSSEGFATFSGSVTSGVDIVVSEETCSSFELEIHICNIQKSVSQHLTVIFVISLPGPGKTTFVKERYNCSDIYGVYDIDILDKHTLHSISHERRIVVIASSDLCDIEYYKYILGHFKHMNIHNICLTTPLDFCLARLKESNSGKFETISKLAKQLDFLYNISNYNNPELV